MKKSLQAIWQYALRFARWLVTGSLIGLICGAVGGLFALAVEIATHLRGENGWLLYLLPLGGLIIAGLYRLMKLPLNLGTDEIFTTVRTQAKVPLWMAPAIFLSTVLTHLLGGSAGREGAALQLGGSMGSAAGWLTCRDGRKDTRRICELCGMAAVFSALFGTPLTACLFVLEVVDVGRINTRAMLPCMISATVAKLAAKLVGAPEERFPLAAGLAQTGPVTLLQSAGMGVICAVMAILFCIVMHRSGKGLRKLIPNDYLRIVLGGAVVIGLSLLVGSRDYNGGGGHVIVEALGGHARPEAFALKLLFTAITLSSGYKGGEIVPSFFVGSTLGCVVAPLMGMPAGLGAALGMVGVFCGVTNAPLASVLLSVELFGGEYLPLFGICAAVSFMLSGQFSLYHSQQFLERKLGEDQWEEETNVIEETVQNSASV